MTTRQRLAAYALITDDAGRVLLTRHPDERGSRGRWVLPGGGVEPGEHPEQALIREIMEETGLPAAVGELRDVLSDITTVGRRRRRLHNVRLVYLAAISASAPGQGAGTGPGAGQDVGQEGPRMADGARWCGPAEWQELPLAPFTERVLSSRPGSGPGPGEPPAGPPAGPLAGR